MTEILNRIIAPDNIISLAVVAGAIVLWLGIRKAFAAYGGGKGSTVAQTLYHVTKYVLLLGAALTVLQIYHVNVSSLVAGLGIASAVVGLALQDVLKDSIMGMHMLTDHFFEVGDVVRYGDFEGVVISFNINTTKLRSITDNSVMTICNRNISEIVRSSDWVDIDIPLPYEESVKRIHAVLEDICRDIRCVEGIEGCEYKGTQEFADSAVVYKIRLYCPPERRPELRRRALRVVQEGLEKENIRIPYHQMDVHSLPRK